MCYRTDLVKLDRNAPSLIHVYGMKFMLPHSRMIIQDNFLQAVMVKIFIWPIDLKSNPYLIEAGYWCIVISGEVEN